jgi:hypothetical protein
MPQQPPPYDPSKSPLFATPAGGPPPYVPPAPLATPAAPPAATPIRDFLGEATAGFNPIVFAKGLWGLMQSEASTYGRAAKGDTAALQRRLFSSSSPLGNLPFDLADALSKGEYAKVPKMLGDLSYLPVVGPRLKEAQTAFEAGETAKGMGILTDVGISAALPAAAGKIPATKLTAPRPILRRPGGEVGDALDSAAAAGVPRSLATEAASSMAKLPESLGAHTSFTGAEATQTYRGAEAASMRNWAGVLTEKTAPGTGPLTLDTAGDVAFGAVQAHRRGLEAVEVAHKADVAADVARQAAERTTQGQRAAGAVHPAPVSAYEAGTGVLRGTRAKQQRLDDIIDASYDKVRAVEKKMEIQAGGTFEEILKGKDGKPMINPATGQPWTKTVTTPPKEVPSLMVDPAATQAKLKPIFDDWLSQVDETKGMVLQGPMAEAFQTVSSLMKLEGPIPLSAADRLLSSLKRTVRQAESAVTRNVEQGAAASAIGLLEKEVQMAVTRAGPEVRNALAVGRAATKTKYAIQDLLRNLNAVESVGGRAKNVDPVRVADALTKPRDLNLGLLQQVQRHAPEAIPQLGRTVVDTLLEMDPAKAMAKLDEYGPQSRAILFGKDRAKVDTFFRQGPPPKPGMAPRPSIAEQMKDLPTQPVEVLTKGMLRGAAGPAKLDALIDVIGPDRTRNLGRALVEDLAERLTGSEKLEAQTVVGVAKDWRSIDPKVKAKLLQDPALIKEWDHFFIVAERLASAPPSNRLYAHATAATTHMMLVSLQDLLTAPLQAIREFGIQDLGGLGLTHAMNNPRFVKALTTSMTVNPQTPAAAAAYANLARIAQQSQPSQPTPPAAPTTPPAYVPNGVPDGR